MTTFITATNIPPSTAMITELSQSSDDEQNPTAIFPNHHFTLDDLQSASKSFPLTDDENLSNEENDYPESFHYKNIWPQLFNRRYANKVIRGGISNVNGVDARVWAIPYRFGKRAAMPYRFGKRAGMHFRLGKKSITL